MKSLEEMTLDEALNNLKFMKKGWALASAVCITAYVLLETDLITFLIAAFSCFSIGLYIGADLTLYHLEDKK